MTDTLINAILTIFVALVVILADYITSEYIASRRKVAKVNQKIDELISQGASGSEIAREVKKVTASKYTVPIWGSDLASIAFSLDIAILGIWISKPDLFPFFSKWNDATTIREIPVWLCVLFVHLFLLFISILFKHSYSSDEDQTSNAPTSSWKNKWLFRKRYIFLSNAVGFFGLFSAIVIITNSM